MEPKPVGIPARGEDIGGKYRVEKVIGQGAMGAVFAARNLLTGKRVAIEWSWPEHAGSVYRERLLREKPAATLERAPRQGNSEARLLAKRAAATGGRQREPAGPEPPRDSRAVIPGKRTNGLSVNDF